MPSLKRLKSRICSVKSTQKITKAMQLISASRLHKAREELKAAESYVQELEQLTLSACAAYNVFSLTSGVNVEKGNSDGKYSCLVIIITSDRGLCGAFNASIIKYASKYIATKKVVKLICIGKKGYTSLMNKVKLEVQDIVTYISSHKAKFLDIAMHIAAQASVSDIVDCYIIYNRFISVLKCETICKQLMPLSSSTSSKVHNIYTFEPDSETFAKNIIERNLVSQIYYALLHHAASEHSARMVAMDHATNNSQDIIEKLNNQYNKMRQACVTTDLIEIISGAQAI